MANAPRELAKKKTNTPKVSSPSKSNSKQTKKVTKKITKVAKKNPIGLVLVAAGLVIGLVIGYLGVGFLTKNDTFEMNAYDYSNALLNLDNESARDTYSAGLESDDKVTAVIYINEEYKETGAKCVAFGKDISSDISVTYFYREDISYDYVEVSSVDTSKNGFYYALYKTSSFRYSSVDLIRNIIVVEVENDG